MARTDPALVGGVHEGPNMTLTKRWRAALDDEGVSPVIAVILMVAITVVLAATVYVWVSGFATEDTGPEQASATASGADLDDNGDVEWVKVTLTKGENAPYSNDSITYSITDPDGSGYDYACETAQTGSGSGGPLDCTTDFSGSWDVGENLWVPCQTTDGGNHLLSISVEGTAILDTTVTCDEAA